MRSCRENLNTKKWVEYEGTPDFQAKIQLFGKEVRERPNRIEKNCRGSNPV
jgi:hypothetical protein